MPIATIKVEMLRGEINGVLGEYTTHGWMIDYACQCARAVIVDTGKIGDELRKLRLDDVIDLKLVIENLSDQTEKIEYHGKAKVQMIRFRASRKEVPHFRTQFKLIG